MTIERFGTLSGQDVLQVSLEGPDGMAMQVLTWGAVVRDLTVPLAGGSQRVVLGLNSIEDYVAHSPYFGAIVGRYGNRIGKARFTLDGETYRLDANEGENQLHGGSKGFGSRLWSIVDHSAASVTLGASCRKTATWAIRAAWLRPAPIRSCRRPGCGSRSRRRATSRRRSISPPTAISTSTAAPTFPRMS